MIETYRSDARQQAFGDATLVDMYDSETRQEESGERLIEKILREETSNWSEYKTPWSEVTRVMKDKAEEDPDFVASLIGWSADLKKKDLKITPEDELRDIAADWVLRDLSDEPQGYEYLGGLQSRFERLMDRRDLQEKLKALGNKFDSLLPRKRVANLILITSMLIAGCSAKNTSTVEVTATDTQPKVTEVVPGPTETVTKTPTMVFTPTSTEVPTITMTPTREFTATATETVAPEYKMGLPEKYEDCKQNVIRFDHLEEDMKALVKAEEAYGNLNSVVAPARRNILPAIGGSPTENVLPISFGFSAAEGSKFMMSCGVLKMADGREMTIYGAPRMMNDGKVHFIHVVMDYDAVRKVYEYAESIGNIKPGAAKKQIDFASAERNFPLFSTLNSFNAQGNINTLDLSVYVGKQWIDPNLETQDQRANDYYKSVEWLDFFQVWNSSKDVQQLLEREVSTNDKLSSEDYERISESLFEAERTIVYE